MGFHIIWISLRYTGFWNHYVFLMNWFAFSTEESVSPACSPGFVCLLSRVQLFRDPMNCNPPGSSIYGIDIYGIDIYGKSMGFPREEYWSGYAGRVPGNFCPRGSSPVCTKLGSGKTQGPSTNLQSSLCLCSFLLSPLRFSVLRNFSTITFPNSDFWLFNSLKLLGEDDVSGCWAKEIWSTKYQGS